MFNREIFFDEVRNDLFGGAMEQVQVDGMSSSWRCGNTRAAARRWTTSAGSPTCSATVYHETRHAMWPIKEYGRGEGHEYGEPDPETGQTYYGRGFVQLTWREQLRQGVEDPVALSTSATSSCIPTWRSTA